MSIDVAEPDLHSRRRRSWARPPPAASCSTSSSPSTTRRPTSSRRSGACDAHLAAHFPYSYRITIADNASTDATPSIAPGAGRRDPGGRRRVRLRGEGPRPGAADGVGGLGRGRARLLRRRPLDRPGRAAPPGRPADLRALRPRDRHPARPRLAGRPRRRSGSSSRAATTCCCAAPCRPASPTPSAASRPSAPTSRSGCCRWSRTPAGSSTPRCWCSPSARACGSTRCRSTGSTTPTPASTSSRPRWPTCAASGGSAARSRSGALPLAELRAQLGRGAARSRACPGVPTRHAAPAGPVRRDRRGEHARAPAAVPAVPRR